MEFLGFFFEIFLKFLEEFFWRISIDGIFWEKSFRRIVLRRDFSGGIFWEGFFVYIGIDLFVKIWFLSRFCLNGEGRKEGRGQEFRSLEVRGKLIALKN